MPTKQEKAAAAAALKAAAAPEPVRNCSWTNNNAACANTWFCLSNDMMGQHSVGFDDAATIKMSELAFWNKYGGDNREVEAEAIASMLTKMFTKMLGAIYEPGYNYASAVLAMTQILTDATKTLCELAAVVDEQHHFMNER